MLFACSCIIYYCDCEEPDATDSDDDDKLQEALQLVEILKSEYSKVLQENDNLRSGPSVVTEISTCPTTKPNDNQTTTVNETAEIPSSQATPVHSQAHVATENPSKDSQLPFPAGNFRRYQPRNFRRFMKIPMDYYYYGLPKFRRFDYVDAFGAHPNITVKPITVTPVTIQTTPATTGPPTSSIPTTSPTASSTASSTTPSTKSSTLSSKKSKKKRTARIVKLNTEMYWETSGDTTFTNKPLKSAHGSQEEIKKLHLMQTESNLIASSVDPVLSQVASELINEFKTERTNFKHIHPKIDPFVKSKRKTNVVTENWRLQAKLRKTSYKIYLSGSTKIPVPYPENHAFCFTNPDNALCRTLIK